MTEVAGMSVTIQTYALLLTAAMASSLNALGGYFICQIDFYDVILSDTIGRDEIGSVAGERISTKMSAPLWAGN